MSVMRETHPGFKGLDAYGYLQNHTDSWSVRFVRALCRRMLRARWTECEHGEDGSSAGRQEADARPDPSRRYGKGGA
jgi:hypothetical protein